MADPLQQTNVLPTALMDWELDVDTHDLLVPIRYVFGSKAVAQRCRIALKMFVGELFSDRAAGTPWIANDFVSESEAIMGDEFDRSQVNAGVRRKLNSIAYVQSVTSVSSAFDSETRTLDITANIVDIWGNELTVEASKIVTA